MYKIIKLLKTWKGINPASLCGNIKTMLKNLNLSAGAPQTKNASRKMRDKFLIIFWIAFYLTIFSILINNSFNYLDPDLGWHLKAGEEIVREKAVPNLEYYNYTLEGQTWVDHEWLSNIIVYWLYNKLGYPVLNAAFALIIIIFLIILNIFAQKYIPAGQSKTIFIVILQILGVIASLPHFGVRVQEISVLFLLLLFWVIEFYNHKVPRAPDGLSEPYRDAQQDVQRPARPTFVLFLLLPLFYLWASAHGGFLIGIVILFFWLFIKLAEIVLAKFNYFSFLNYTNKLTLKQLSIFLIFALGGIVATLITPYGLKLYEFLNTYRNDFYLKQVQEWLPFYYLPINYWQILFESILTSIILLALYYALIRKSYKIPLWWTAFSIFFLALALKSKRHFPLLFISSFPLMIDFLSFLFSGASQEEKMTKQAPGVLAIFKRQNKPRASWAEYQPIHSQRLESNEKTAQKARGKYLLIIQVYLIVGLLALGATKFIKTKITFDPFISFKNNYPYEAVNFLKNHPEYDNLKLFSEYNWGGYLIWTLPEKKLFIDGRLPHQPFAGRTLLEEYLEFNKKERVEIKISQYDIEQFLIYNNQPRIKLNWFEKYFLYLNEEEINKTEYNLKSYLNNSPNWQLVYSDKISNIYVKKR